MRPRPNLAAATYDSAAATVTVAGSIRFLRAPSTVNSNGNAAPVAEDMKATATMSVEIRERCRHTVAG